MSPYGGCIRCALAMLGWERTTIEGRINTTLPYYHLHDDCDCDDGDEGPVFLAQRTFFASPVVFRCAPVGSFACPEMEGQQRKCFWLGLVWLMTE